MDCRQQQQQQHPSKSVKIDERSVQEQKHRKASRLWTRVIQKQSSTNLETGNYQEDESRRGVRFHSTPRSTSDFRLSCPSDYYQTDLPESAMQRKMAKMKTFAKRKSPLQKFDEIVTRELTSRQLENDNISLFDGCEKWQSKDYGSGKGKGLQCRKISFDARISKTTLVNVERELKNQDKDPSDVENAALMDAIDKLIQAQASCRFDAAVRAAEAAAASVPPEMAEEVAINCAKEYSSEIIDIVNEKVSLGEGKRPVEVMGYIGITKVAEPHEEE